MNDPSASSSKGGLIGTDESTYEDGRGEVLTPTVSAIEAAENPLDRRAMVSLKKQLQIDNPQTSMDFSVSDYFLVFLLLMSSSLATYQGVPHAPCAPCEGQATGYRGKIGKTLDREV